MLFNRMKFSLRIKGGLIVRKLVVGSVVGCW